MSIRCVVRRIFEFLYAIEFLYTTATMENNIDKPKRGRPPKSEIERLRDRIWIHAVLLRSSLKTGYGLETAIDGDKVKRERAQISRPGKWDRYVIGSHGPGRFKGKRDAVLMADAKFPGTADWYRSPLWWALEAKPKNADDCEQALHRLDIDVAELLLTIESRVGAGPVRPRCFDEAMADELVKIGSFDALAAAVVMARWAEAISSPQLRNLAVDCCARLQPVIATIPELAPFYQSLFKVIDTRCTHWTFLGPNQRTDTTTHGEDIRCRTWKPSNW